MFVTSQCDLTGAVHQLISNHSDHREDESGKTGENITVSVSQFTDFAAGSVLYLVSPGLVCTAVGQGKWGEETEGFLHRIAYHDHHEHHHEESRAGHAHEHIDIHGLEELLYDLHDHYEPEHSEVSL